MWLLDVRDQTLKYSHSEKQVPGGYAILSHTWGEDEVTFEEIRDLPAVKGQYGYAAVKEKSGYAKINHACGQSMFYGLDYAWVDTCESCTQNKLEDVGTTNIDSCGLGCIDKRSSAELSEAINSMFRWYAGAAICFAYLDDLDRESVDVPAIAKNFRHSRWFYRGWTLQELIAPKDVEFYGKNWYPIGDKESLLPGLSDVTGISAAVLKDRNNLSRFSIAQRLSWAAMRQTTRIEDEAYCLLGIFDVNLPLLYGEGRKAYQRLQEEIIRASATIDHSILAWTLPCEWIVPGRVWSFDENTPVEAATLLSPSPRCFRDAHDIISWGSPQAETFEITKTGLRITASIIHNPLSSFIRMILKRSDIERVKGYWIALNCRDVHRPGTMIVLRLLPRPPVEDFGAVGYGNSYQNNVAVETEMVYERNWREVPASGNDLRNVQAMSVSRDRTKAWERKTLTVARQQFQYPWHGNRTHIRLRDGCSSSSISNSNPWLTLTHVKDKHVLESRLDITLPLGRFKKDCTIPIIVRILQDGLVDPWSADFSDDVPSLRVQSAFAALTNPDLSSGQWKELPTGVKKTPLFVRAQYVHLAEEFLWALEITTLNPETDDGRRE